MEERMLKVSEVAELLRINPETVKRWLRDGRLRGFRPGGTKAGWRIPSNEVQRIMAGNPPETPRDTATCIDTY